MKAKYESGHKYKWFFAVVGALFGGVLGYYGSGLVF